MRKCKISRYTRMAFMSRREGIEFFGNRLASTFSIVGFDPVTKDLGVAVQSRYFSVGPVVPWAQADVGAVATQSFVNVSYGPRGLQLLKQGLTVDEVIAKLTGPDEGREMRQLGIMDAEGNAAAYTGKKCMEWAGSRVGENYSAQGNILANGKVVEEMGHRFESSKGDLAEKLVAALEGGEAAGGDRRGRQSAALLVVRKGKGRADFGDRLVDLRVEDHTDPIAELKRLLKLHRVYYLIDEAESQLALKQTKKALATIRSAIRLDPRSDDAYLDLAMMYVKLGEMEKAKKAFRQTVHLNPRMKGVVKQLPKVGLIKVPKGFFEFL
jgi:uncharacterized Ntn-hydrolase superfamily protein